MSIDVKVPPLGESVPEATVGRWLKKEGEAVAIGDPLVELETEKVNVEVTAETDGTLEKIAHGSGDTVKVGEVLGSLQEHAGAPSPESANPGAEAPATGAPANPPSQKPGAETPRAEGPAPGPAEPRSAGAGPQERGPAKPGPGEAGHPEPSRAEPAVAEPASAAPGPAGRPPQEDAPAGPAARRAAAETGVDLAHLTGSGPAGRITLEDVTSAAQPAGQPAPATAPPPSTAAKTAAEPPSPTPPAAPTAAAAPPAGEREERVRLSRRRLTIARRLVEAQQTAAILTTFNEVDMNAVMQIRKRRKASFQERHGVGLGFMSFFTRAAVGALKALPLLNSELQGEELVLKHYYDIGIAVSTDEGLVVPVLRDADRKSFAAIENAIAGMAKRARENTLTLEELMGGTFTITNGGVFGSLFSTPILNPPQVGILGMHRIEDRPVARQGEVVIRPMMILALSYDHRVVDGREAVLFLSRIKELIEDPESLLLEG
ncbi:MAG TPA: 2-oxoglutarate dehydrogenase complex dihydrolipoyllysine-residue succinyltransferase [Armatimonadota bacterium]|nr:2-oxoglutarate dehydrogenase complex dihydrolipoyllysine-residue succinyltransferase [Armatimonadota bacterium]